MKWVLLVITIANNEYYMTANGSYFSLLKCNKVKQAYIEKYSKPEANFEIICVRTDQVK